MANDGKPKHNYTYIGKSTNPKDHEFDNTKYNQMIDDRDYQGAYDYAMQFRLNDLLEEDERVNELKNMLRDGHVVQTIYKNIDESDYPAIDFRNNVMQPGGLERLGADNEYANKFKRLKDRLGDGANRLQIRFQPQKQTGIFGWDWISHDNDTENIDVFYENSGLNKQYLEANGVIVRFKDGYTYLEFDKSNDLANKILLNLPTADRYPVHVNGIKDDGSIYDDSGFAVANTSPSNVHAAYSLGLIPQMKELYNSAKNIEDDAYEFGTSRVKQYSSQVFPLMYENAKTLEDQLAEGKIKSSDFNTKIKRENKKLIDGIAFINPADYEIQTAFYNKDGDPVNKPIEDQLDKQVILQRYKNTDEKDIKYSIVITGGRAGLMIQLPEVRNDKGDIETYDYDIGGEQRSMTMNSITFSIFGDDIEQKLQRQINNDPGMQSYQEINDMQDLGYTYKDNNGNTYVYDGVGGWIVNGDDKSKSTEWVRRQIHKDKAAQDIGRSIVLNNISVDGNIVNPKKYSNQIMVASFMIANDANKDGDIIEALKEIYGNRIDYTDANSIVKAIFELKGVGNVVADKYRSKIPNPATYEKFNDIYEIYSNMLNVGNRYIRNINE